MDNEERIDVESCCIYYNIEYRFLEELEDAGLIHFQQENEQRFLSFDELANLEKLIRLHEELEINVQGLEAISHILDRMTQMQQEIREMRQKLG